MSTNSELRTVGLGFCWQDYEVGDRFQTIGRSITEADLVSFINTTGMTEVMFNNLVYIDEKSAVRGGRAVPISRNLSADTPHPKEKSVLEKVVDHSENGDWTQKQVDNAFKFMKELPGELVIAMWTKLTDRNFKNAQKLHKQCSQLLLEVIGETNS